MLTIEGKVKQSGHKTIYFKYNTIFKMMHISKTRKKYTNTLEAVINGLYNLNKFYFLLNTFMYILYNEHKLCL